MSRTRKTVNAGNGADEPAIGHVGEGGKVGVLTARWRDGTTTFNPCLRLALLWVGRLFCEQGSVGGCHFNCTISRLTVSDA